MHSLPVTLVILEEGHAMGLNELEKYASQNQILFIANKENRGYSAGNNIGLKTIYIDNIEL